MVTLSVPFRNSHVHTGNINNNTRKKKKNKKKQGFCLL